MSETCIIVGAGQAAGQLVASLQQEKYTGKVLLIGSEPYLPYQRPPLSKNYLAGKMGLEKIIMRAEDFYQQTGVELLLGQTVVSIDRDKHSVALADARHLHYDKLALATGSRVRRLSIQGADLDGVCYLRGIGDADDLRERFARARRAIIVGGGYIGLEVAAIAVSQGLQVDVLEMAERLMPRTASKTIAEFYRQIHTAAGVNIHCATQVAGFRGEHGRLQTVYCADGSEFAADVALVGIGIEPNTELAAAAGLKVDNGIVADEYACTEDPDIVALGDCSNHPNALLAQRLRLESVPNALAQARTAAATLCGKQKPYNELPWFWSDQYDLKLQIAGLRQASDQTIVRGDPAKRSFIVFAFRDGKPVAAEAVNRMQEFMLCKQLLAKQSPVDPELLQDESKPLQKIITNLA